VRRSLQFSHRDTCPSTRLRLAATKRSISQTSDVGNWRGQEPFLYARQNGQINSLHKSKCRYAVGVRINLLGEFFLVCFGHNARANASLSVRNRGRRHKRKLVIEREQAGRIRECPISKVSPAISETLLHCAPLPK
jgi:hypothetical protein